ncbi:MAG: alpha/beta fold hydrolase [Elusimicrobia bacterium]|nr:alpha/beta fold hydrolase [Elusimicrobiota bacterium]
MRLLWAALVIGGAWGASAVKPAKTLPELPGELVELRTQDGWTLKGRYFPAQKERLTFILLHGRKQRKEFWQRLALELAKAGYGCLGLDLRGHGGSATAPDGQPKTWKQFKAGKGENDYADMSLDIQAAVAHLGGLGISEDKIGLIGFEVGGSVGAKYAAVHPKVPMFAWLSPGMSHQEVVTVNAVRAYKDRPILLIYSERDKYPAKETPILYAFAKRSAGERNATLISVPDRDGAKLLNGGMCRKIVEWIANPIKPEPEPVADDALPEGSPGPAAPAVQPTQVQ